MSGLNAQFCNAIMYTIYDHLCPCYRKEKEKERKSERAKKRKSDTERDRERQREIERDRETETERQHETDPTQHIHIHTVHTQWKDTEKCNLRENQNSCRAVYSRRREQIARRSVWYTILQTMGF